MSNVTLLYNQHEAATKTIHADGTQSVKAAASFLTYFEEFKVSNIRDLSALLTRLEMNPRAFVIRGAPTDAAVPGTLVRRLKNAQPDGTPAYFKEIERPYLMIDIDSLVAPDHINPTSVEAVEYAIGQLPTEFRGATAFFQFSSNAGLRGQTIKLHLWYWLDRPLSNDLLRSWSKSVNEKCGTKLIDPALYQAVQPHFIAAPILIGIDNPVTQRSGLLPKTNESVSLVVPEAHASNYSNFSHAKSTEQDILSASEWLSKVGDFPGGLGFHEPLRQASWHLVESLGQSGKAKIKEQLRKAIRAADKSSHSDADIARYVSDAYLDDLILGADKKLSRRTVLTAYGVEPHFCTKEVDAEVGVKQLQEVITQFFDNPKDTVVRITTGAGKTTQIVEELARRGPSVGPGLIYVPHLKLAREVETRLLACGTKLKVQVIEGRKKSNCANHEKANAVAMAGLPVKTTTCISRLSSRHAGYSESVEVKCPYFDACRTSGYMSQFQNAADVYILASSYLSLGAPSELPDPKWIVIDESFYAQVIGVTEVRIEDLECSGSFQDIGLPLLNGLRGGRDPIEVVRSSNISAEYLKQAATSLYSIWQKQFGTVNPRTNFDRTKSDLKALNPAHRLFSEVAVALEAGDENCPRVLLQKRGDEDVITISSKNILWKAAPTLNLDATADSKILDHIFADYEFKQIDIKQNIRLTQVTDHRVSKSAFFSGQHGRKLTARCQTIIDQCVGTYKRALVVTYKSVKANLQLPEGWAIEHFGGLRGVDKYKDVDALIIFGNSRPPVQAMEAQATALMADMNSGPLITGELKNEMRGYRAKSMRLGVQTPVHADELVQACIEQCREAELVQAIGRVRAVHGRIKPVDVFLVTSIPIDLPVDRFLSLDELASRGSILERLLVRFDGVVPLSPKWLAENASDLFKNEKAAKNWITRKWAQIAKYIYSEMSPLEGEYRKAGQSGPIARYIYSPHHRAPRAVLERHVGEVSKYKGKFDQDPVDFVTLPGSDKKYYYRTPLHPEEIPGVGTELVIPDLYSLLNPPLVIQRPGVM